MSTIGSALVALNPIDDETGSRHGARQVTSSDAPRASDAGHLHRQADHSPDLTGRIEKLTHDLAKLATQNQKLLKSVSHLLDLYEAEKAQRLTLQESLDRVVEDMAGVDPKLATQDVADEIRRGVSDDLKPLLHAILDLLEISMRRTPSDLGGSTHSAEPPTEEPAVRDSNAVIESSDDLPRALPEILTRPVEELVASPQAKRIGKTPPMDQTARGDGAGHGDSSCRPSKRRSVLDEQPRPGAWIPVTSDKSKA